MTRYFLISDIIFIYFSLCCPVAMEKKRVSLSQLIPGTLVIQHLQSCKLDVSDCGLCAVHESWKLHQREWVRVTLEDGVAKLGCSVCCGASLDGPWAEFKQKPGAVLRKHCLDRHEKSKAHQQALKSHSDRTLAFGTTGKIVSRVSSEHDARSVSASRWSDFRQGNKNAMGTDRSHFGPEPKNCCHSVTPWH